MKYNFLHIATFSMIMIFFNACSMEQIATGTMQLNPTVEQQMPKKFSALRQAMNENIKGTPRADQLFVTQTIAEMIDAGILEKKHYYYDYIYNEKTKPSIIRQFFTHYPKQICPELQSIVNNLNDFHDRQDFLTILLTTKTEEKETKDYIKQLVQFIKNKEGGSAYKNKAFNLSNQAINKIQDALNEICSHLNKEYVSKEEPVTIDKNKIKEVALLRKIKTQHTTLGQLLPIERLIHSTNLFNFFFQRIKENNDPKNERAMVTRRLWEQRLEAEAITCINAIVNRYAVIFEQLQLVEERFQEHSLFFLRKTVEHNEQILEQHPDLFNYYQRAITEQQQEPSKEESSIELPTLLLEPKPAPVLRITPQEQPPSSTVVKIPEKIKQVSREPKPQPNRIYQAISFIWNGITTFVSNIYYGVRWIITEITGSDKF